MAAEISPALPAAHGVEIGRCERCQMLHVVCFDEGDQPAYSAAMSTEEWVELFLEDPEFREVVAARLRPN